MLADKARLLAIIDDIERGLVNQHHVAELRHAVQRLDELDDLVEAVCACRTQEVPILRHLLEDDAPGRP